MLAEVDSITKPKPRSRCMWIISEKPGGIDRVYCSAKATVAITGCAFCPEHGARHEARRIRHDILRECGIWLPLEAS